MSRMSFELLGTDGAARRGRLTFPRGTVETPAFMPVGTYGSVKGVFTRDEPAPPPATTRQNCRMVQVDRQFQRPIAWDVDYVYKGTKYRSRLAEDPGNRLRVRVAVTPWEDPAPLTASP